MRTYGHWSFLKIPIMDMDGHKENIVNIESIESTLVANKHWLYRLYRARLKDSVYSSIITWPKQFGLEWIT